MAAAALVWIGYWFSCGVVVVAELFPAEAWAQAAAAVGEDVAALVLFGLFGCWLHLVPLPTGYFLVQSLRRKRDESRLPSSDFAVKDEGPAFGRALFVFSIYV